MLVRPCCKASFIVLSKKSFICRSVQGGDGMRSIALSMKTPEICVSRNNPVYIESEPVGFPDVSLTISPPFTTSGHDPPAASFAISSARLETQVACTSTRFRAIGRPLKMGSLERSFYQQTPSGKHTNKGATKKLTEVGNCCPAHLV
jgi:hypothetical protein